VTTPAGDLDRDRLRRFFVDQRDIWKRRQPPVDRVPQTRPVAARLRLGTGCQCSIIAWSACERPCGRDDLGPSRFGDLAASECSARHRRAHPALRTAPLASRRCPIYSVARVEGTKAHRIPTARPQVSVPPHKTHRRYGRRRSRADIS